MQVQLEVESHELTDEVVLHKVVLAEVVQVPGFEEGGGGGIGGFADGGGGGGANGFAGAAAGICAPQEPQNRAPGSIGFLHDGHVVIASTFGAGGGGATEGAGVGGGGVQARVGGGCGLGVGGGVGETSTALVGRSSGFNETGSACVLLGSNISWGQSLTWKDKCSLYLFFIFKHKLRITKLNFIVVG